MFIIADIILTVTRLFFNMDPKNPTGDYENAKYYHALNLALPLASLRLKKLIEFFQDPERIWKANANELGSVAKWDKKAIDVFLEKRKSISPEKEWKKITKDNVKLVTIFDNAYPPLLKEIYSPPVTLYVRGKIPTSDLTLAVVGSRKISAYGKNVAQHLISGLANSGCSIISGLAIGTDTVAHSLALENNLPTVSVLASGVDRNSIYPVMNRQLAEKIITREGAMISEYPPGTRPLKYFFPLRNRIISGLSHGIIMIEAAERSGALITARHALEQNREVFAIPGNIFSETSKGTNNLIKMGAKLTDCAKDILEEFGLADPKYAQNPRKITADNPKEETLLRFLTRSEPIYIDKLAAISGLDSSTIGATLTVMEIKGKVRNVGGMRYILAY